MSTFYGKHMAAWVAADALVWKGYMTQIGGENSKQGFPRKREVLIQPSKYTCDWVRGIPVTDHVELEAESTNLFRNISDVKLSVLNLITMGKEKSRKGYSWTNRFYEP